MIYRAPAKVNLSLRILGKRADGFHDLESLFVPISLADELEIDAAEAWSFRCDAPDVPVDESNLVVRAARAFARHANVPPQIQIALRKRIPHGAGLGGGSSDAATTLLALNEIHGALLPFEELLELAAELGSDVPFFMHGSAAICRGRGELVEPLEFGEKLPLLLLKPPFGVPTPWAYQRWKDAREIAGVSYAPQEFAWGKLVNDLERPVFEKYLFLAELKTWLLARNEVAGASMSGSGSTVFAVLTHREDATRLSAAARAEFGESLWTCACDAG